MLFQITLRGRRVLRVRRGDHFGFTWLRYGVISFDYHRGHYRYAENPVKFNVGNRRGMHPRRYGNRIYSIRLGYRRSGKILHYRNINL